MKIVVDTNLFVAQHFNRESASAKILKLAKENKVQILWTEKIKKEVERILRNIKAKKSLRDLSIIFKEKNRVFTKRKIKEIKEDPEDNKFLEAAFEGKARLIVSSDAHLLRLKKFQEIPILTPKNALDFILNKK